MGRITNLIPLLTDSHTSTYKKAFHPYERQKNRPKIDAFPRFWRKTSDVVDGLRRGEEHGGVKASCSGVTFFAPLPTQTLTLQSL